MNLSTLQHPIPEGLRSKTSHLTPASSDEICQMDDTSTALSPDRAVRLDRFEIIWIETGTGRLTVDLQTIEIDRPMVVCVAPGQLRTWSPLTAITGFYLSLSYEYLNLLEGSADILLFNSFHYNGRKLLSFYPDPHFSDEMRVVIHKMLNEFYDVLSFRSEMLKGLMKIFLIYISRSVKPEEDHPVYGRDAEMVQKFMGLLKRNFKTMKKVSHYADELCVTPNYLNQIVKRVSGYPASYHIQQQIVLEAKRQAAYTGLRMKEIADGLGFHDYAHFSKFFKTYSGVSFSSFKSGLNSFQDGDITGTHRKYHR